MAFTLEKKEETKMEGYKERMIAEYRELKDRYGKLHRMLVRYDAGTLDFPLTCPVEWLREQAAVMGKYLYILEMRAEKEGIGYDALSDGRFTAEDEL